MKEYKKMISKHVLKSALIETAEHLILMLIGAGLIFSIYKIINMSL